jgi:hypothetical protein
MSDSTTGFEESCSCPAAGWCERRQITIPSIHWKKCQAGAVSHLDHLYSQLADEVPSARPAASKSPVTNKGSVGDRLTGIIKRETGVARPCVKCLDDVAWLNSMTPAEVRGLIEDFTDRIFSRASEKADKWYQKLAILVAPDYVKSTIRDWLIEAIEAAEKDAPDRHRDGVGRPRQP